MAYVGICCRLLIATVFAVAVVSKVSGRAAFDAFVASVRRMAILPDGRVRPAARATAAAEGATVLLVALPWPVAAAIGFALANGLLSMFALAIGAVLRRGERVACRCFGVSAAPLTGRHIVRNMMLIAVAVVGIAATMSGGATGLAGALVAAFAGVAAGAVVTLLDDLVALLAPGRRAG